MEFSEVVRRRRMVRRFTSEPVPEAALETMLANAVRAPSAGYSQGWGFLVLTEPEDVARFWEASTSPARATVRDGWLRGMTTAPAVVVVFSNETAYRARYAEPDKGATAPDAQEWAMPYWHIDAGMASLLILQTAVDEGLGACFFGVEADRHDPLREAFAVPVTYTPVGAIAVGHPDPRELPSGSPRTRRRRPQAEVVHRGRWAI